MSEKWQTLDLPLGISYNGFFISLSVHEEKRGVKCEKAKQPQQY